MQIIIILIIVLLSKNVVAGLSELSAGEKDTAIILSMAAGLAVMLAIPGLVVIFYLREKAKVKLAAQNKGSYASTQELRFDIFVSYSAEDKVEARSIAEAMRAAEMKVFFAQEQLQGGSPFSEEIRAALRDSREVWVLATPTSVDSVWVATEWGTAWALGKRIVPVLLNAKIEKLPDRLRMLHVVDFHDIAPEIARAKKRVQESASPDIRDRVLALLRRPVVILAIIVFLIWLFSYQTFTVR